MKAIKQETGEFRNQETTAQDWNKETCKTLKPQRQTQGCVTD